MPEGRRIAIFDYGFRPFFLLAGLYGAVIVPASLLFWLGWLASPSAWPVGLWHAHELLFGYALAVIAGFLLTAVPGWQQMDPVTGRRLAILAAVWVAGRAALWLAGVLPDWLVAAVDLLFLPSLIAIGVPGLLAPRARRNRIFLAVLGLLLATNGLTHLAAFGVVDVMLGARLGLDAIVLLIAILGGRVVPAFTTGALAADGLRDAVQTSTLRDAMAIGLIVAVLLADAFSAWPLLNVTVALLAAAANLWRLAGWGTRHTLGAPIVWVLHLAYAWLAAGLLLKGLAGLDLIGAAAASHGLAIGAVGTMTLAIMTRAALGHTGRPVVAPPAIVAAYLLISLAAVARIAADAIGTPALVVAAAAWTLAYVLFVVVFWPILTRPRPDGRPG